MLTDVLLEGSALCGVARLYCWACASCSCSERSIADAITAAVRVYRLRSAFSAFRRRMSDPLLLLAQSGELQI